MASTALAEGNLSLIETYETEFELVHKPVLVLDTDLSGKEIQPGGEAVVTLKCFGKAGWYVCYRSAWGSDKLTFLCSTSGLLELLYANTQRLKTSSNNDAELFGRQLLFPLLVTVYQMLECQSMNITKLAPVDSRVDNTGDKLEQWSELFGDVLSYDWCLCSIHVSNNYNLPFEVRLTYKTGIFSLAYSLFL